MKKFLAVALLSTVAAAPVFAAESGAYAGITVGRSKADNPFARTTATKDTDTVGGILVGYQYTKNWGVEVFYTGVGKLEVTDPTTGGTLSGKGDALGINVVGTAPISDVFSLYAKLGYASIKTNISTTDPTIIGERRGSVTGGLGAQYNVSKDVGIRLGWDTYELAVKQGTAQAKPKTNVWSMGVMFKF